MARELVYTSAPRGLMPGSTGYCTVAMTQGMPTPMIQRLEGLSGYRKPFKSGSPGADQNPPAFAHWVVNIGGCDYSVLSRVRLTDADQSGRRPTFAHHVILEEHERVSAGPAGVMMQPEMMLERWSGEPRYFSGEKTIRDGHAPRRVGERWTAVSGDAGWAGTLAECFLLNASKPAYIIFKPGTDLLPLINEAIALLPERDRWRVTFSTYFTALPAGLTCAWRCCVAGTAAAAEAPGLATSGVVINLTTALPPAPEGKYAAMARSGQASTEQGAVRRSSTRLITAPSVPVSPGWQRPEEVPGIVEPDYSLQPVGATTGQGSLGPVPGQAQAMVPTYAASPAGRRTTPLFWAAALTWPLLVLAGWYVLRDLAPAPVPLDREGGETVAELRAELEKTTDLLNVVEERAERADQELNEAQRRADNLQQRLDQRQTLLAQGETGTETVPSSAVPGEQVASEDSDGDHSTVTQQSAPDGQRPRPVGGPAAETCLKGKLVTLPFPELRVSEANRTTETTVTPLVADVTDYDINWSPSDQDMKKRGFLVSTKGGLTWLQHKGAGRFGQGELGEVGRAELSEGVLSWTWAEFDPTDRKMAKCLADGLPQNLLKYATVDVYCVGGGNGTIQFFERRRLGLKIGGSETLSDVWPGCAAELVIVDKPKGWTADLERGETIRLRGRQKAKLALEVQPEGDNALTISATWAPESDPAKLAEELGQLPERIDHLVGDLRSARQAEHNLRAEASPERRKAAKERREEQGKKLRDAQKQERDTKQQLEEINAMSEFRVKLVARHSGALVAELTVSRD